MSPRALGGAFQIWLLAGGLHHTDTRARGQSQAPPNLFHDPVCGWSSKPASWWAALRAVVGMG